MRFKHIIVSVLLALTALPVLAGEFKLGVVDSQQLLSEYPEAKAANSKLRKDTEKKRKALETLGNEIEKLMKEYTASKGKATEQHLKEKEYVIRKKKEAFDKLRESAEAEIEALQTQASREVFEKLKILIAETAKAEGVNLVLDKDRAYYADNTVDLTAKIIAEFKKVK